MAIEIRAAEPGEVDLLDVTDNRGFGQTPSAGGPAGTWTKGELERTRCAFEGREMVGVSRAYSFELTVPGGARVPAAAVSWVSVLPTHRRRGILTRMLGALHDDAREREEPAAILTASEASIYGRFGYGVATWRLGLTVERVWAAMRPGVGESGVTRFLDREEADRVLPAVYARACDRAGMVSRPEFWWPQVFWGWGHGDKAFFVVVHEDAHGVADGYVAYEITGDWNRGLAGRHLLVWDLQATSPEVHAALWRFVSGVDLVGTISATNVAVDDPLRHLLVAGRRARVNFVNDGLWLFPIDPAAVLASRTYDVDDRVVLELYGPGDERRRLALEAGPAGAQCAPTDAPADLECSVATLGACALGGNRWSSLGRAGLVVECTAGALRRADRMFATDPAPAMLSYF